MPQSVRITDEDYEVLKLIKIKTGWLFQDVLSKAINFYAKTKRILPWDTLPTKTKQALKQGAKDIIKGQ